MSCFCNTEENRRIGLAVAVDASTKNTDFDKRDLILVEGVEEHLPFERAREIVVINGVMEMSVT